MVCDLMQKNAKCCKSQYNYSSHVNKLSGCVSNTLLTIFKFRTMISIKHYCLRIGILKFYANESPIINLCVDYKQIVSS